MCLHGSVTINVHQRYVHTYIYVCACIQNGLAMWVFQWQNQFFVPHGDANLIANDRQMQNGGQRAFDEFVEQMATICSGMFK